MPKAGSIKTQAEIDRERQAEQARRQRNQQAWETAADLGPGSTKTAAEARREQDLATRAAGEQQQQNRQAWQAAAQNEPGSTKTQAEIQREQQLARQDR